MKKAILLSIQPKWLQKILNGEKTIEIRKTIPSILPIEVFIYCTKSKDRFYSNNIGHNTDLLYKTPNGEIIFGDDFELQANGNFDKATYYNGKVVAKFKMLDIWGWFYPHEIRTKQELQQEILEKACITLEEIEYYAENENIFFAWCIDDLEIFDKPLELSEFYKVDKKWEKHYKMWNRIDAEELARFKLSKAPQSWQYVYVEV